MPKYILPALLLLLGLHVAIALQRELPRPDIRSLPEVPALAYLRLMGLGNEPFLSRMVILWLQAHDYQQGVSVPYKELDYRRVMGWLDASLDLDPDNSYPLLLASRVYASVNDPDRQRQMLEFVAQKFVERPAERWQWLAHAVYVAKHRLHDQELALRYARLLSDNTTPQQAPDWARQMHIFILADMGEVEAAKVLLGALVESGELSDPNERAYLLRRLEAAEADMD